MLRPAAILSIAFLLPTLAAKKPATPPPSADLAYTATGEMIFPANYREWTFLTSGLGMTYNPAAPPNEHPAFDNVFVNPSSYKQFVATGTWPDKTVFILEVRGSETKASIDQRGTSESTTIRTFEVHVKDSKLPGNFGFFEFNPEHLEKPGKFFARPASCYTCHEAHAAVDTTFVQFYPTLLPIAKAKQTLSPEYLKEMPAPATK